MPGAGSLRCELVHGRRGVLARESVVKAPLFVVSELREIQSGGGRDRALNVVLSLATAVKEEWLRELFPHDFNEVRAFVYDPTARRVVARSDLYRCPQCRGRILYGDVVQRDGTGGDGIACPPC